MQEPIWPHRMLIPQHRERNNTNLDISTIHTGCPSHCLQPMVHSKKVCDTLCLQLGVNGYPSPLRQLSPKLPTRTVLVSTEQVHGPRFEASVGVGSPLCRRPLQTSLFLSRDRAWRIHHSSAAITTRKWSMATYRRSSEIPHRGR